MSDPEILREAILSTPLETSSFGEEPKPGTLYVPPAHIKTLRLESNLVVGARGVGKSFWTAALASRPLREHLGMAVPELDRTDVGIGFSSKPSIDHYPDEEGFSQMSASGTDPYDIWRAVVFRWVDGMEKRVLSQRSWPDTVVWIKKNWEDASRMIEGFHGDLVAKGRYGLILFDALDRTSNDWQAMDTIVRGLLRTVLWLKSFPNLNAKVFLRDDQFERTVTDFPDASKLSTTKTELSWERYDLHGLLWQRLVNAPENHGIVLRNVYREVFGRNPEEKDGIFELSEECKRESDLQRTLFKKLAGPWMGKDPRRGTPYTWVVGHLSDGRGQTSPRSFLSAIQHAAEDSRSRYGANPLPLHYESLKRGIRQASNIRVDELAEDYPWVRTVLETLRGLNVPCDYDQIRERWHQSFPDGPAGMRTERLPAQQTGRGWDGIRDDLKRLGVLDIKRDDRIDMPDIYRVGFGLGRKGGVRPK